MIPNVTKSAALLRTVQYLVGPGREEEHLFPHLVAGPERLMAEYDGAELSLADAGELAAWLDGPRQLFGTDMTVEVTRVDPQTGDRVVTGTRVEHTWHCSLSIPPGDGTLGDERWRVIATEFADAMGLTEAGGSAPVRWVAIHHGPSKNGNDHVHLVASMVREDGTRWDARRDYPRAQQACRELEARHGLLAVAGPARGVSERGVKPAEAARAAAAGAELTEAQSMALRIRAAALASSGEAEFVRRVRAEGMVIKPRYAKGSTSEVVGYKVAAVPREGEGWVFYGGGKLAKDLSLPRLRETWPAPDAEAVAAAVGEWRAAHAGTAVVDPAGRETRDVVPEAPQLAVARLAAWNDQLAKLPLHDDVGWAEAARQAAGAVAAWAAHDPEHGPDLAKAARVLARSAQSRGSSGAGAPRRDSARAVALLLAAGAGCDEAMGRELTRTAALLARRHQQLGYSDEATKLAGLAVVPMRAVAAAGRAARAARKLERVVEGEPERAYGLEGPALGRASDLGR